MPSNHRSTQGEITMNEQQLIIDAKIEKDKLKRVSDAVSRIQMKKLVARRSIEDILGAKQLEASLALSL